MSKNPTNKNHLSIFEFPTSQSAAQKLLAPNDVVVPGGL